MNGLLFILFFWPRAMLKGPKRSFVVVDLGMETWVENALKGTKNAREQNLLQIKQKMLQEEQKNLRMKIVFKVTTSLFSVFLSHFTSVFGVSQVYLKKVLFNQNVKWIPALLDCWIKQFLKDFSWFLDIQYCF